MFDDDTNDVTNNPVDPTPAQAEVNGQAVPAWDEPQAVPTEEPAAPTTEPAVPDWDADPAPQTEPVTDLPESSPVEEAEI